MTTVEGQRFSQIYLTRGEPTQDSQRARLRVYRLFTHHKLDELIQAEWVELALGVKVPHGMYSYHWEEFFTECELRDFLDLITVVAHRLGDRRHRWVDGVHGIFRQENLRYKLDAQGGVHIAIDGEFAHNQDCTLAVLNTPRYGAARSHFEASQRALDSSPPETREAIRQTFETAETIFKLMFADVARLGSAEATKKLTPLVSERLTGTEKGAAGQMLEAFKAWINSAHPYRHGQGVEVPDNPSLQSTVLSVSLGASFVRWLAELDSATT